MIGNPSQIQNVYFDTRHIAVCIKENGVIQRLLLNRYAFDILHSHIPEKYFADPEDMR